MAERRPVLLYDRVAANRRATVVLLALLAAALVPVAAAAAWLVAFFSHDAASLPLVVPYLAAILLSMIALALFMAGPDQALRLVHARPVARAEAPDLWRAVENLAIGTGLPLPRLYLVPSATPNAFAVGWRPADARLAVTEGLVGLLDRRELQALLAHEFSQIGNRDIRVSTIVMVAVWLLRLPSEIAVLPLRLLDAFGRLGDEAGPGRRGRGPGAGGGRGLPDSPLRTGVAVVLFGAWLLTRPWFRSGVATAVEMVVEGGLALVASLVYLVVAGPFLGSLFRRTISGERELLADADAVLVTRDPLALATALAKVDAVTSPDLLANGVTDHLWVVDPGPVEETAAATRARVQPPVAERIARLRELDHGVTAATLEAAAQAAGAWCAFCGRIGHRDGAAHAAPRPGPAASGAGTPPGLAAPLASAAAAPAPPAPTGPAAGDGAADDRAWARFRLSQPAPLYAGPDASAAPIAELPIGAVVRVAQGAAERGFLRLVAPGGTAGYIPRWTAMVRLDVTLPTLDAARPGD